MRIKLGSSVDVAENLTFSLGYSLFSELVSQMLVHEQKNHQRPSDKQCEANGKAFLDLVAIGMKLCGTITSRNPKIRWNGTGHFAQQLHNSSRRTWQAKSCARYSGNQL